MRNEERAAKRLGEMEDVTSEVLLELPEPEKKDFNFKSVFTADGFKKFGVRNLAIVLSVLVIGVSVFVNWSLFGGDKSGAGGDTPTGQQGTTGGNVDAGTNTNGEQDYFSAAVIEREGIDPRCLVKLKPKAAKILAVSRKLSLCIVKL